MLETAITDRLLGLIRTRRSAIEEGAVPERGGGKAVRRPAQLADFAGVAELKARHGLGPDSIENWERLWVRNPALRAWHEPPTIGWVLEDATRIVGFMGSIPLSYHFRGRSVRAATTHALVIEPKYRAFAPGIISSFFRQPGIDLFLNTTAVPSAAKLVLAFGARAVPQPDYGKVLFWVLNRSAFAQAVGKKLGLNAIGRTMASAFGPAAICVEAVLRSRKPKSMKSCVEIRRFGVDQIGTEFDVLWESEAATRRQLLGERSRAALRWHFSGPATTADVQVLAAYRADTLVGYAVLFSKRDNESGLRYCSLADVFVANDEADVIAALVSAGHRMAKQAEHHLLEVIGFPQQVRRICEQGNPYSRQYPACPFYYKAPETLLNSELASAQNWYASPYDGDGSLGY